MGIFDQSILRGRRVLPGVLRVGPYTSGPYDAIKNLSPDLFAQFRYPVYAGEQVLFRDPACTVPVTDAGVHTIGGAKDPFTGAIILTQADAEKQFLWMGESIGARADGIDDYMIHTFGSIPIDTDLTVATRYKAASNTNKAQSIFRADYAGGELSYHPRWSDGTAYWTAGSNVAMVRSSWVGENDTINGDRVVLSRDTVLTARKNGLQMDVSDSADSLSLAGETLVIGAFSEGLRFFDGTIQSFALWTRSLSGPEISTVEGVLA